MKQQANRFAPHDLDLALVAYFDAMKASYGPDHDTPWSTPRGDGTRRFDIYADKPGQKFLRIIHNSGNQKSSHSFIVLRDCEVTRTAPLYSKKPKEVLTLKAGDILKCASWRAPALNFVRGNIFDENYGNCKWTGAA
jgi:hypothetical protein